MLKDNDNTAAIIAGVIGIGIGIAVKYYAEKKLWNKVESYIKEKHEEVKKNV